jgi:hypothetical protein
VGAWTACQNIASDDCVVRYIGNVCPACYMCMPEEYKLGNVAPRDVAKDPS